MRCEIHFDGTLTFAEIPRDLTIRLLEFQTALRTIACCVLNQRYDAETLVRSAFTILPLMLRELPFTWEFPSAVHAAFAKHALRTAGRIPPPMELIFHGDTPKHMYRDFLYRVVTRDIAASLQRSHENFICGYKRFQLRLESVCRRVELLGDTFAPKHIEELSWSSRTRGGRGAGARRRLPARCNLHLELLDIAALLGCYNPGMQIYVPDVIDRLSLRLYNALGPAGFKDFWRVAGYDHLADWDSDIEALSGSVIQKELNLL
ncbi:PO protein [Maize yellow dwarf virus RMV]|uniref:PO protein n=1 Tax=Maize yellow dwarf virus RMV TaxID=2170101 RepID=R9U4P1_9VIRU|nr:PO protein [Maize yellow dwarf virus RMV]AGN49059.1 PO protein [Maize yellow dwarf virus RMV]